MVTPTSALSSFPEEKMMIHTCAAFKRLKARCASHPNDARLMNKYTLLCEELKKLLDEAMAIDLRTTQQLMATIYKETRFGYDDLYDMGIHPKVRDILTEQVKYV